MSSKAILKKIDALVSVFDHKGRFYAGIEELAILSLVLELHIYVVFTNFVGSLNFKIC